MTISLLDRYFFNRRDKIGIVRTNSPFPVQIHNEFQLEQLLLSHIRGECRVGSYTPGPDQCTAWFCIDIDGPGHSYALTDPEDTVVRIQASFAQHGISTYIERSGGGHGYHLWGFFETPVSAEIARALGLALAPCDALLSSGSVAEPSKNKGIEIFPKQDRIAPEGLGNMVYLPSWGGGTNGGGQFFQARSGVLVAYTPTEFQTNASSVVSAALSFNTSQVAQTVSISSSEITLPAQAKLESATAASSVGTSPTGKLAFKIWREKALAALPLETVYGTLLTGKSNNGGWLECRDPSSPSGDGNPSASVADTGASAERGSFHSFRDGKTISVFDFLMDRSRCANFKQAMQLVSELSGIPIPKSQLPAIVVSDRQLRDMVEDSWSAILAANEPEPSLFRFGGAIARLVDEEHTNPRVEHITKDYLIALLARTADWFRIKDDIRFNSHPPPKVANDMLALPHKGLPLLEGIANSPLFGLNGNLLSRPGFHPEEKWLLGNFNGLKVGTISPTPMPSEVDDARTLLLNDLFGEFPFVSSSDRAHAVAALLLPFARRLIRGCTPGHLVEAPTPGSGKGLLCDCISLITTGSSSNARVLPRSDDEIRKMIIAELLRSRPIIVIDNVDHKRQGQLDSPSLAAVLTALEFSDRMLGVSQMVSLPNNALWLMTGNTPS